MRPIRNWLILIVIVAAFEACAARPPAGRIAIARPLELLSGTQPLKPVIHPNAARDKHVSNGLIIFGSRGQGLNAAASIHRLFLGLGIPSEVSCRFESSHFTRSAQVQSRIQIAFPQTISPRQRREISKVMALLVPPL